MRVVTGAFTLCGAVMGHALAQVRVLMGARWCWSIAVALASRSPQVEVPGSRRLPGISLSRPYIFAAEKGAKKPSFLLAAAFL
ncbi:hypothetical protein GCM10009734_94410 [Nonomuraea bangladeshensis]